MMEMINNIDKGMKGYEKMVEENNQLKEENRKLKE